ncbi:DUF1189 domain-containing protein [Bacillus massiliigorillae]|uniref:DUF1189 domain-containing protein n=1 Tax=Bacillus massiliigorillae TaxID=1243664 RepID=UPI00039D17BD|nr:DUF1189 domain-containing protein [Bacillus massiliigorillae]
MNIFKQFWLSLYSPKDIAKFRFQGIGKTILYVFLLVLISTLPSFIYTTTSVKDGVASFKDAIEHKIPAFEIKNGKLHTEAKEPIIHNNEDFDIFFDGTGSLTAKDVETKTNNGLALLKSEFVIVANGTMQAQSYSLFQGFTLTKDDVQSFMKQIDGLLIILIVIVGIFTYIMAAGLKFIEITIIALVGKLLASAYNPKLQYRHMWRITAYSVTISTVFFTIMGIFQTSVIGGMFVNWAVTLTMLYLVIKEIPLPKPKQK